MTNRSDMTARVDAVFNNFRHIYVAEPEVGKGEIATGGSYQLALDPLSPYQAINNPRIGRYVHIPAPRAPKHTDSMLCTQRFISNVLAAFYALAVKHGQPARVAWARFACGLSLEDTAEQAWCSFRFARQLLRGEKDPDLYLYWNDIFTRIHTPGSVYECVK